MEKDEQSLNILILADIHFGYEKGKSIEATLIDQRQICLENLIEKLEESNHSYPISAVIIVGDIAFSSGKDEYIRAENWIRKLFSKIGLSTEEHLILCPGNHDIKQQINNPWDTIYFPTYEIAQNCLDLKYMSRLSKRYSKYEEFIERLGIKKIDLARKSGIGYKNERKTDTYLIQIKKFKDLQITALNSSWFSRNSDHDTGKMAVGMSIFNRLKINNELTKYDEKSPIFSIICFHHPFEYLWPSEKDALINELPEVAHLVITGHIHNKNPVLRLRKDKELYEFQCGATYINNKYKNYCHILQLDTINYEIIALPLTWENKKWVLNESGRYPQPYKKKFPIKTGIKFTQDFENPVGSVE